MCVCTTALGVCNRYVPTSKCVWVCPTTSLCGCEKILSLSTYFSLYLPLSLSTSLFLLLSIYISLSLSLYSSSLYRYVIGMYRHQSVCGCVQQHLCVGVWEGFSLSLSLSTYLTI